MLRKCFRERERERKKDTEREKDEGRDKRKMVDAIQLKFDAFKRS